MDLDQHIDRFGRQLCRAQGWNPDDLLWTSRTIRLESGAMHQLHGAYMRRCEKMAHENISQLHARVASGEIQVGRYSYWYAFKRLAAVGGNALFDFTVQRLVLKQPDT